MRDKISIIIPVFNLENYISEALNSVFLQTYSNLEIIVVDDGSTDGTAKILDALAMREKRLMVIHKQNEGALQARITGILHATGTYVGFVDGDDRVDPDMFERLHANAAQHNAAISHCGYRTVYHDQVEYYYNTGVLRLQNHTQGVYDLLEGAIVEPGLCNKLIRKEILDQVLREISFDPQIKNNEDLLLNYYLFQRADRSVFEDFCPYQYCVRKDSASKGKLTEHMINDPVKVSKIIYQDTMNDPALHGVASRLYVTKLIKAATLQTKETSLLAIRSQARKQLRAVCFSYFALREEPLKRRLLALWAAAFPCTYTVIHNAYLKYNSKF